MVIYIFIIFLFCGIIITRVWYGWKKNLNLITIYATRSLLPSDYQSLYLKQILWYVLGFGLAYIMMIFGNKFLYNNAYILYFIGVILLILVLLFGKPINNARCWFIIPYIGSFQPSEFMKIFLIIILSRF